MKILLLILIIISSRLINAQTSNYIHTNGKNILGPCNDTLIIKGINYAPYNWGYTLSDLKIDQIAQTGANTVRLVWYWNNPGASVYSNYIALDSAISKCIQHNMIVIVELHDFTCANNPANLTSGSNWWTTNSVFTILNKYKQSIIVNIANEALQVNWTANPTTSLATYNTTYQNIITSLRSVAGFDFPIMIDAPDCGQNIDAFVTSTTAGSLITFDPKHNIIFSAHAYWYGYASNDSLQMATKINNVLAQNIPFVLGEVANLQDDATMCQYNLNYKPLLNYCKFKKVGWLIWSWDHDGCAARQLSSTGNFVNLTTFGNDIVNNLNYGLTNGTVKSQFLVNGNCDSPNRINTSPEMEVKIDLYPNPSNEFVKLDIDILQTEKLTIIISDAFGEKIIRTNSKVFLKGKQTIEMNIADLPNGLWLLTIENSFNQKLAIRKFVITR